jgi:hypothetical protein
MTYPHFYEFDDLVLFGYDDAKVVDLIRYCTLTRDTVE